MNPQAPGPEEYFDDGDGGEFITRRGAAMLLGYAEAQSVKLPTVPVADKQPRAPRHGRPIKSLVLLEGVLKLAEERGQAVPTNASQQATGGPDREPKQAATPVSSMEEAKLRRQLDALTKENAKLKLRLDVVEPLLVNQMDSLKRLLAIEDGRSSA